MPPTHPSQGPVECQICGTYPRDMEVHLKSITHWNHGGWAEFKQWRLEGWSTCAQWARMLQRCGIVVRRTRTPGVIGSYEGTWMAPWWAVVIAMHQAWPIKVREEVLRTLGVDPAQEVEWRLGGVGTQEVLYGAIQRAHDLGLRDQIERYQETLRKKQGGR